MGYKIKGNGPIYTLEIRGRGDELIARLEFYNLTNARLVKDIMEWDDNHMDEVYMTAIYPREALKDGSTD